MLIWGATLVMVGADPAHVLRNGSSAQGDGRVPLAPLTFFGLVTFLGATGEGVVRTFFNVYLDMGLGVTPAAIGTIMGAAQLLPIGAALASPILVARWGTGNALVVGLLGMGIFLVPLAAIPLVWVAGIAYMGIIAMIALSSPVRDLFGQEIVSAPWRTTSQSAATIGLALGWATAGIAGGALIKASGFGALYFAGALAALLGVGLLVGYLRWANARLPVIEPSTPVMPEELVP